MSLQKEIEEAENRLAILKQQAAFATCSEMGSHNMLFIGGRNAGCESVGKDCCCSVPVYQCSQCQFCDYGDNEEAKEILENCDGTFDT